MGKGAAGRGEGESDGGREDERVDASVAAVGLGSHGVHQRHHFCFQCGLRLFQLENEVGVQFDESGGVLRGQLFILVHQGVHIFQRFQQRFFLGNQLEDAANALQLLFLQPFAELH